MIKLVNLITTIHKHEELVPVTNLYSSRTMLQLILLFCSLIAVSSTSCNQTCGGNKVPYPFGFSASCDIHLSCNSTSGVVSLSGFPVQHFTTNNTFMLNVSTDCSRNFTSASKFFSTNYALTRYNGLFLRNCPSSDTSPCLLSTSAVSQMSQSSCNPKGDNLTCLFNNTAGGGLYFSKYDVLNKSTCRNLFTSVMYENLAGQTVLALGNLEIGWWMNGDCRCAANATCKHVDTTEGKHGYWCNCDAGFTGDGYANGTGCHRESSPEHNRIAAIAGGSAAGATLAAALFLCILCWRRYGKSCSLNEYQITTQKLLSDISCTLPIYSYREVERATNSFAETNKLGTGGYGTVYVGKLLLQNNSTEDLVAIKRIRYRADADSINQLTNEIKLISSVSHPNLVQLLGCCIDNGEQILIYEYMPNGTLSYHLHPDHGHSALSWPLRVAIASETAKAVAYLHNSLHPPIYHRDIKSSNILLDRDFNPKVADFGLSRAARTELSHISTAPQGTPGYLDPEYHQNFHLSDKSDVYSFGVVLIEIITAMKVVDFSRGPSEVNLASLAVDRIGRGRIEEILDPFLIKSTKMGKEKEKRKGGGGGATATVGMKIMESTIRLLLFSPCILLLLLLLNNASPCNASTDQNDVAALNVLFQSLNSPSQLQGWTANGGDPCGQSWRGVSCSHSRVTSVKLNGLGLTGTLGYNLDKLTSLTELDLSNNNIGSQIPYGLPPNVQTLNLGQNQFSGQMPYSISQMTSLKSLNIAHNGLQGNLSDFFSQLSSLTTLDLSFNGLTGDLPQSFSALSSLNSLYLQNNQFTGYINVLALLPLQTLNIANNRFTGWIPSQLKKINSLSTDGNSWNSGPAPPPPPYTAPPPPPRKSSPGQRSNGNKSDNGGSSGGSSGIGGGAIAGIIIAILVVGAIAAFFVFKKKKSKASRGDNFEQHQPFKFGSNDVKDAKPSPPPPMPFQASPPHRIEVTELVPPVSLKPPPKIEKVKAVEDDGFSNRPVKKSSMSSVKATVYSVADLQIATDSFSVENLIGEGTFGRVYRAQFSDGKILAVKKLSSAILPHTASDEFAELVTRISKLHHPNLTELVGYCMEHGQHLLVYEFHPNGSLHDLLHVSDEYTKPLSWNSRVKIALGSARALEYLHEVCSPSVVHKNFKSSNILLDAEYNPHVSDAGLANLISDDQFQASDHGTGYNAPEVAMSGQYNLKSDVYSFGVVMLELLTGRKPFDSMKPRSEQSLVRWAAPQLHDIDALDRMVDPALKGLYPAKSLSRFADVIALCVQPEPEFRPPMSEVVQALVRLVQRANMTKRMLDGDSQGSSRRLEDPDMQEFV